MYEYIKGMLVSITPEYIVIDNHGVGYKVYMANPFCLSNAKNQEITIYIHHAVREDSELLYGFNSQNEKKLFEQLLKVSGIGPKSALAIMATDNHQGFIQAIENSNITYLTKFPGVGKKTAQQIIIDLQGKLDELVVVEDIQITTDDNIDDQQQIVAEAKEALKALGYTTKDIAKVEKKLVNQTITTTDEYLRQALRVIMN